MWRGRQRTENSVWTGCRVSGGPRPTITIYSEEGSSLLFKRKHGIHNRCFHPTSHCWYCLPPSYNNVCWLHCQMKLVWKEKGRMSAQRNGVYVKQVSGYWLMEEVKETDSIVVFFCLFLDLADVLGSWFYPHIISFHQMSLRCKTNWTPLWRHVLTLCLSFLQSFTVLSNEGWPPPEMFALLLHHSLCLQPHKTAIHMSVGGSELSFTICTLFSTSCTVTHKACVQKKRKKNTVFLNCLCCVVWTCLSMVTPDCICTYFPTQSSYCLLRLCHWWNMLLMKP